VNLSQYAVKANNLSDLPSAPDARTNLGLGTMATATASDYSTTTVANGLYYPLSGNPSSFITASALTPYLEKAGGIITGNILSNNGSSFSSYDNVYKTATLNSASVQLNNAGPGGYALTMEWDGITFQSGKQTVHYPGAATLFTSPVLTGDPTAPTPATSDNDTSIATTAFVKAQGYLTSAPVTSVAGRTGAITLSNTDISGLGSLAVVNDAPSDGSQYARKNGAWDVVSAGAAFISSVSSPLAVTTGNLTVDLSAYLTSATAASTYQTLAGMSSYLTTATAASTYYLQTNPSGFQTAADVTTALSPYLLSATAATTYYPLVGNPSGFLTSAPVTSVAGKVGVVTLDNTDISGLGTMSTATAADYSTTTAANGLYYPLAGNPSSFLVAADITGKANLASPALTGNVTITSSTGAALFITQTGTGNILTLHDQASDTTFVAIDANGKVNTIPSEATNGAGFNVPHATAAPTTPVNGDVWTTTGGLFVRINSGTQQFAALSTNNTFSNASAPSAARRPLARLTWHRVRPSAPRLRR
jgi:hypothetical protein